MAILSDEDTVYLIESVVGGLHIWKRVRSVRTVSEGLQLTCEDICKLKLCFHWYTLWQAALWPCLRPFPSVQNRVWRETMSGASHLIHQPTNYGRCNPIGHICYFAFQPSQCYMLDSPSRGFLVYRNYIQNYTKGLSMDSSLLLPLWPPNSCGQPATKPVLYMAILKTK